MLQNTSVIENIFSMSTAVANMPIWWKIIAAIPLKAKGRGAILQTREGIGNIVISQNVAAEVPINE